ncbi:MAG TPA: DUF4139 domain-containing protein [Chthoniobacteraceae bacterium]|nr:DUF4139 domain-containing protein [Chthoniobacteraceae bacterium]
MKKLPLILAVLLPAASAFAAPAITLYNQDFAVVRDTLPLDLKAGVNNVQYAGTTAKVEPSSVILRDPAGKVALQILEQNYRNDPVSEGLLLSLYEGQTIEFETVRKEEVTRFEGKIIRSGYNMTAPPFQDGYGRHIGAMVVQPIIEVGGKLQFGLPGKPIFPALKDQTILKPTLDWKINAGESATLDAEIAYITGGMSWEAAYNVVAPEKGDEIDMVGWITMKNESGTTFEDANIKLMAGDVSKLQPEQEGMRLRAGVARLAMASDEAAVTEKAFDEFHLYTLAHPTTLHDKETKQVEFVRAAKVKAATVYVYDGLQLDAQPWARQSMENLRNNQNLGTESNSKVAVMREFRNSKENHLGLPLPKGVVRFYRQDDDGRLEFTGENVIDHTPKDETLRIYTGNAFDLVGERIRTDFKLDTSRRTIDESVEIKLRNRKEEPVEIRVVEHLYRWYTWEITEHSLPFEKKAAQVMEFRVPLKAGEEKSITYTVRYSW